MIENDIEESIVMLNCLLNEVYYYKQQCEQPFDDPEASYMNQEAFETSIEDYLSHREELHELLETWYSDVVEHKEPIDLSFYRILKELREG